jgi:hypothetical protein
VTPLVVGCYSYTPITPAAAPTGSEVRVQITGAASDRVGPLLHSFDTRVLIGSVVENNAGDLVLQVPSAQCQTSPRRLFLCKRASRSDRLTW